jgi:DNA-binding transcriptional MerR regulator/DNA gyrase inhibitor GyrI
MTLMTISEVTGMFGITTRTLRYYDSIGLLRSKRKDDYAYRVYDEQAVRRLRQIVTLRKLRIPLKKIALIYDDAEMAEIVEIFHESVEELDGEIEALGTIRDILNALIERLGLSPDPGIVRDALEAFEDRDIADVVQTLSLSKINLREDRSMSELNKANGKLSVLKNVRIIYLPPGEVAASHYFGENPETNAGSAMDEFIRRREIPRIKPDFRIYGFNNPSPRGNETYGYEFWSTIPDGFDVDAPLVKKRFAGGLYAAHCIKMGDFHEWELLMKWIEVNEEYEYETREPFGMGGGLEEHINAYSYYTGDEKTAKYVQLDLLTPIKPRT